MPRRGDDLIRYGFACAVAVGFLLVLAPVVIFSSESDRLLWRAASAYGERNMPVVEALAAESFRQDPDCFAAAVVAGDAASGLHEHFRAIAYYQSVPDDAGDLAVLAHRGLGERWLMLGDMEQSEESFRFVLDHWPDDFLANKRFAYLMQVQGRTWESVEPTMRMIQQGLFGASEIHIVGCPQNRFIQDERFMALCRDFRPDDWRPDLAEANLELLQDNPERAETLLRGVIARAPTVVEPRIRLGRILIEAGRLEEFFELDRQLPAGADSHVGTWMNRGLLAEQRNEHESAARCFYEALLRAPTHVEANYMLSQVLVQLDQPELAEAIGTRAETLARIELTIPEFYAEPTPERVQRLMADFESIGRYWEAVAMCHFSFRYEWETHQWIKDGLYKYGELLRHRSAELQPRDFLASLEHLSSYSVPDWSRIQQEGGESLFNAVGDIRFEDRALEVGLQFTYFNGSRGVRGMEHIFETTGGGIVALDFDQNLWPDLYLTQGAAIWEGDDDTIRETDRIFRNAAGHFLDVTESTRLGDEVFSQGATAGDFNNDGFQDLYVCNLYGNRFYENNGDGTFTEVTSQTGTAGDEWSLSSILVDLNHDAIPDLYVVNYLDRASVFDRRCRRNGEPLTCAPTLFPAEQDRVYLGQGDGRFQEVTQECGVVQSEGKGLAILAADLDDSGNISVFVGNDTTPNFLYFNRSQPGGELRFVESGILTGLAVDGRGRSQATMGVAFGDVNGDHQDDIFITNFYGDANTMYFQTAPGSLPTRRGSRISMRRACPRWGSAPSSSTAILTVGSMHS